MLLVPVSVQAQVTVEASIDTLVMLIGQQRELTLEVTCGSSQRLEMPVMQPMQPLKDGVELVERLGLDTIKLNDGKRIQVRERWAITAFDSALVYLPPFEVKVDGKPYLSKSLALKVLTIPVDTVHLDRFAGPKDIHDNPFSWDDWSPVFWWSVLLLILAVLLAYVSIRYHQNKPIIRIVKRVVKLPPHQVAIAEIERIKVEKKWAEEDSKEYYTLLTDAIRTYIRDRFSFNATEMTSSEIIERLVQEGDETTLAELRDLFQTADLVKFAKWTTLIGENDRNLLNAIDFINQTKVEVDPNAKAEPEEITVEERQNRARSITMRVAIIVLALALLALLGYVGWQIFDLIR
ncbi:MAG: hypothetical protein K6F94_08395 [Bacteroidaceae bacterium]|nr:hypothetical protein [Bacteroidaceae bacterium]